MTAIEHWAGEIFIALRDQGDIVCDRDGTSKECRTAIAECLKRFRKDIVTEIVNSPVVTDSLDSGQGVGVCEHECSHRRDGVFTIFQKDDDTWERCNWCNAERKLGTKEWHKVSVAVADKPSPQCQLCNDSGYKPIPCPLALPGCCVGHFVGCECRTRAAAKPILPEKPTAEQLYNARYDGKPNPPWHDLDIMAKLGWQRVITEIERT